MNSVRGFRPTSNAWVLFLSFAVFSMLAATPLRAGSQDPEWVKIGEKKVNHKLDRDEIYVLKSNSRFSAIQFRVTRSQANIARCSVHFGKGKAKVVKLGQNIGEGGRSRVIRFGAFGPREVTKVVVWYDTQDESARKAVVEVWGRQ